MGKESPSHRRLRHHHHHRHHDLPRRRRRATDSRPSDTASDGTAHENAADAIAIGVPMESFAECVRASVRDPRVLVEPRVVGQPSLAVEPNDPLTLPLLVQHRSSIGHFPR